MTNMDIAEKASKKRRDKSLNADVIMIALFVNKKLSPNIDEDIIAPKYGIIFFLFKLFSPFWQLIIW